MVKRCEKIYLLSMTDMILCLLPIVPIRRRSSMDPSTDCMRRVVKRVVVYKENGRRGKGQNDGQLHGQYNVYDG